MRKILVFLFCSLFLIFPSSVSAHAFGQLYTLPIPVWLYLWGGGAAVLVSFILIGFFVGQKDTSFTYPKVDISRLLTIRFLTSKAFRFFLEITSLLIFALTILAGFLGPKTATDNFATIFVWIIFWLGLTYFTALLGNLWSSSINPFKILIELFEQIKINGITGLIAYPKKLGYLPALIFFYIFIWLELLSSGWGTKPAYLSSIIVVYTLINLSGVVLFGKNSWFKYCEFFSVFFALIGKISPFKITNGRIFLRPPFVGLLDEEAGSFSLLLFIVFMLASTAFDGFRATTSWRRIDYSISQVALGNISYQTVQSALLALSPVFFLALYLWAIVLIKTMIKTDYSLWDLARKFAYSLIPITLAYNIAHYYTLLIVQGQSIIPAVSDPLNLGWNLFNGSGYVVNVGIVSASFIWHSQVAVIIIGHIAAVFIAHIIALRVFPSPKKAILSQIPMLILMIAYTITGLWILSQPLALGG